MKVLHDLGFDSYLELFIKSENIQTDNIGRIVRESKQKYIVKTLSQDFYGEVSGKFIFKARSRSDFPAVGDWVVINRTNGSEVIIDRILPRKSVIERKSVGSFAKKQTIAANVDVAFLMQDIVYDYNLNRLDRLIALCFASNIKPIVILTKIDLISPSDLILKQEKIRKRFTNISFFMISNKSMEGFSQINKVIKYGKTYCFIGASGAGKSTLINNLIGEKVMLTQSIREKSKKGQHTTSHRELFILKNSGILIDTPGIRELGIVEKGQTLESTFDIIYSLAEQCKYSDCKHFNEPQCAVKDALDSKEIEQSYYDNFLKMKEEQIYFEFSKKGIKDKEMEKKFKSDFKNKKSRK